ncbi:hypothetical protein Ccar_03100 [Clostridium carboxidivorans P7]|uniref:Uncharacterized protein n=1 Tax=Clostridium carboxidivorans P7 TaxID=536227 RepID=C6PMQ1_9CLOT|nr:hypothetical protein [Clostridium carboxidivorans]AKN29882.1 hypothetical protein Ccar_03100 [Clostridium carboxidivorans P7]EET89450.1 conserved hypothetical protein [Clostridium carboxidivorans P7]
MNLNFIITILCITMLGIVAMLLGFCYKQELMKALFQSKTTLKKDEVSSEITLNLDKKEEKCNK